MLTFNFTPFPVLTTPRLILRMHTQNDVPEMFFFRSDKDVMKYIEKDPAKSHEEVSEFINMINDRIINNETIAWAMALKEEPEKMIGTISLWRIDKAHHRGEIGYIMHPDHYGKGLMHEAVGAVIHYGFDEMGLHSIEANTSPLNKASQNVLARHGFVQEAYFTENYYYNGKYYDSAIFSLVNRQ